jgi:hypothetical protein
MATMDHRVRSVEACIGILTSISERQQDQIEQAQRDSLKLHRLWVNLCKKYGWFDDEDLQGE